MSPVQIFVVLLSLFSVYYLVYVLSLSRFIDYNFKRYDNDQLDSCEHSPSYCGNTSAINLKCPFGFKGHRPDSCSEYFELSCDEHNRTILFMESDGINKVYLYVELDSIDYGKQTIRVIDPGLQKNNCSTLPLYWLNPYYGPPFYTTVGDLGTGVLIFVSCKNPVRSKSPLYVDTTACNITENHFSKVEAPSNYSYVVVGENLAAADIEESCTIYKIVPAELQCLPNITGRDISFEDIHNLLANGFKLTWFDNPSFWSEYFSGIAVDFIGLLLAFVIAARSVIGIIVLLVFLIYKCHRRHLSKYDNIEEFLQTSNNLMPIRYSYKEIRAITNNFKEKLGEGGYGLVYKGKLRSGSLVAVKMLNKSKANGQEFINEVATIGRIHHANVVRLVGFCVTASKRALVYDYMPNGSLDKFIFSECSNGDPLGWKKAYEIARGVARGIEYLHQGCNMQILHFDIKPHNILLDENFVPKVSDFGLAKFYPKQNSVATLTAVRGTLGYMAPELFYRKIGKVSYKADVYSFGMLLLEIAGRRRNLTERSSQIYYASWIHDKFDQGEDLEIGDVTGEEKGIARKLILIALRCVQMTPADRPSMRDVLKMLEDHLEDLELPPKPMFYPPDSPILSQGSSLSSSEELTEPLCNSAALEIEQIDE